MCASEAWVGPIRSDEIVLMGEQVVAVRVEQRGFEFVVQVFEQEVIAALD